MMKLKYWMRNSMIGIGWCFLLVFSITFNNHSNWILLFFITPMLITALVMVFLPLIVSLEGLSRTMTLSKNEMLEVRVYTRTPVRFRFLNIQLLMISDNQLFTSDLKFLPTKKYQMLSMDLQKLGRGVYAVDETYLLIRDFAGLFARTCNEMLLESFVVCPEMNESAEYVSEYLERRFNILAPYKNRETFDVKSVREYLPGDRLNRIDWKLSSKYDNLVYREYNHENETPVVFAFVAIEDQRSEWMLSLIYTLDVRFFHNTTVQFGLMGHEYIVNPVNRDYASIRMETQVDFESMRHDTILFTPVRLDSLQQGVGQIYCDKHLLVFEQGGRREIVGKFAESGVIV